MTTTNTYSTSRAANATARTARETAYSERGRASRLWALQEQRKQVVAASAAFEARIAGTMLGMAEIQERAGYVNKLAKIDAEIAALRP